MHWLSLVVASGGSGFSLQWRLLLCSMDSKCTGVSSRGTQAWLLCGMWDLPGPGIEPMSPALAGGFLTIGPPRISDSIGLVGGGVARIDHCDMSPDIALETSPRRQIGLQELK